MAKRSAPRKSAGKASKCTAGPFRLALVEWEDSTQPIASWEWADNYTAPKIIKCLSVGYVIGETAEAIALAPNLGDIEHERIQAGGIIRIPRSSIRQIIAPKI